jgi:hypothetical protein
VSYHRINYYYGFINQIWSQRIKVTGGLLASYTVVEHEVSEDYGWLYNVGWGMEKRGWRPIHKIMETEDTGDS